MSAAIKNNISPVLKAALCIIIVLASSFALAVFAEAAVSAKYPDAALTLSGSVKSGGKLTAVVTGADAVASEMKYKWYVGGELVKGAEGSEYTVKSGDVGKIIRAVAYNRKAQLELYAYNASTYKSSVSVVYIDIDGDREVSSKTDYIDAQMYVKQSTEYSKYKNKFTDGYAEIEIRGRGNSTWGQPKKPYKIKLSSKADMFGMGKCKHWVLLANYLDRSNLRNKLSYELGGALGLINVQSVFVEVVVNGESQGLYQFCENIRIDKERVDIFDWEDTAEEIADAIAAKENLKDAARDSLEDGLVSDLSWVSTGKYKNYKIADYYDTSSFDISGGYLIELDEYYDEVSKFITPEDVPIMIKSPEYVSTNAKMFSYIKGYVTDMESAFFSDTGRNSKGLHYNEYADMDSFVNFWIVNQAFKSVELLFKSCYMYKDVGEKLYFGPIWDMDWSSGNHIVLGGVCADYTKWNHNQSQDREYWYRAVYDDPYFITYLEDYWWFAHDKIENMISLIDGFNTKLGIIGQLDNDMWGYGDSFEREVSSLKSWLENRVDWMDTQLVLREPNIMNFKFKKTSAVTLTLCDTAKKALAADTYTTYGAAADVFSLKTDKVLLKIDTKATVKNYELYINGKYIKSVDTNLKAASEYIEIPASDLYDYSQKGEASGRRNIITVWSFTSGGKLDGVSFLTLRYQKDSVISVKFDAGDKKAGGETPMCYTVKDGYIVLPECGFEYENHSFGGWTNGGKTYAAGAMMKVSKDTTFTATWSDIPESKKLSGKYFGTPAWGGSDSTYEKAWDGDRNTFYDPEAVGSQYYTAIQLDAKYVMTKIRIMPRDGQLPRFNGATIYGSNDRKTWTAVFTSSSEAAKLEWQVITEFKNNTGYKYYKYGNDVMHGDVAEIELYGYKVK